MVIDGQSLQDSPSVQHMTQNGHLVAPAATSAVPRALPEICYTLRRKVIAFLDQQPADDDAALKSTQAQTRASIEIVEEALRRYGPDELSLSYNGGKDCLVLLVIILACLPALYDPSIQTNGTDGLVSKNPPPTIQALYIAPPDPFPEVEDFVSSTTKEYHLDLTRYALPMRQALEAYQADKPAIKAIFMGTRRTDPYCEFLTGFSPTDKGWPQFMRVNPILDWHYADIWAFILRLDIPFCSLYQQGYSSLGGVKNTRPNPALAIDAEGTKFRPAYELVRDDEERLGRDK
ncbi:FAD synthetase [Pochonia chlamydosporia 170]|uniref:FAD synthase n=1 Tax=Pochonia chlamydosporia 170 TaxID=1380566 RepID=A0A179FA68_METCM|nr:FAD synthetase [Pochonia chlamydosporia 170]OAQ62352.1 FAD synthetase [Pochonia chlamydosporia 170]